MISESRTWAGHIPDNFDKDQKDYQMKLSAILIK